MMPDVVSDSVPALPSYHMHTCWSDGAGSIREMVTAAALGGLTEVGVSDHLVVSRQAAEFNLDFALPDRRLAAYTEEVHELQESAPLPVRLGIEIDFFPDTPALLADALQGVAFDYVIGSVHFLEGFAVDSQPEPWRRLTAAEITAVYRRYYRRYRDMACTGMFDFLGHLDLPKKFGFWPDADLQADIEAVLDAVAKAGTALEFNTAGWDKPCADPYPAAALLPQLRQRDIPVLISDDAHRPGEVGRHFARARKLLLDAGYTETCRFEERRRTSVPLR